VEAVGRAVFRTPDADRLTLALIAIDANVPVLALAGFGLARHGNPLAVLLEAPWLLLAAPALPAALAAAGQYPALRSLGLSRDLLASTAVTLSVALLFGAAYSFFGDPAAGGAFAAALAAPMVAAVLVSRAITGGRARRIPAVRAALVVGAGHAGRAVIDCTLREPRLRVRVVGAIDDDPARRNGQYKGVPVLGTSQRIAEAVVQHGVSLVVVAVTGTPSPEMVRGLVQAAGQGVEVLEMTRFWERATGQIPIKAAEGAWLLLRGGLAPPQRPALRFVKRSVDIGCTLGSLALALPLGVLVAVAIKLTTSGPVFRRFERIGRRERPFQLLLFRTTHDGMRLLNFITECAPRATVHVLAGGAADPRKSPIRIADLEKSIKRKVDGQVAYDEKALASAINAGVAVPEAAPRSPIVKSLQPLVKEFRAPDQPAKAAAAAKGKGDAKPGLFAQLFASKPKKK
jgi:hypothetical protein